jgi:hypothetical protein
MWLASVRLLAMWLASGSRMWLASGGAVSSSSSGTIALRLKAAMMSQPCITLGTCDTGHGTPTPRKLRM